MAKPPGMGFLSPGPLFLLPLSQSIGYRDDVASDYGGVGREEGGGLSAILQRSPCWPEFTTWTI